MFQVHLIFVLFFRRVGIKCIFILLFKLFALTGRKGRFFINQSKSVIIGHFSYRFVYGKYRIFLYKFKYNLKGEYETNSKHSILLLYGDLSFDRDKTVYQNQLKNPLILLSCIMQYQQNYAFTIPNFHCIITMNEMFLSWMHK